MGNNIIEMNGKQYRITILRHTQNIKGEILESCDAEFLYKGKWHNVKNEQILIDLRKKYESEKENKTMGKFTIETMAEGHRWFYTCTEKNGKGETLVVEVTRCENSGGKKSLPYLWKKSGSIDRVLENYYSISTYVTDTEGGCRGDYNPQHKLSEDGKRYVINFEYMAEATPEYLEMLITKVYELFISATGKTATEKKIDKINAFAKDHGVEVLEKMPEGWFDIGGFTAPLGTTWITNKKSIKSGKRKDALLLV